MRRTKRRNKVRTKRRTKRRNKMRTKRRNKMRTKRRTKRKNKMDKSSSLREPKRINRDPRKNKRKSKEVRNELDIQKNKILMNLSQQIITRNLPLQFAKPQHNLTRDNTLVVVFDDKKKNNFQDLYRIDFEFLKGFGPQYIDFHYTHIYKPKFSLLQQSHILELELTSVHTTCILYATDKTGTDYKISIHYGYDNKNIRSLAEHDNKQLWASIEYGHDYNTNQFLHVCPIRKSGRIPRGLNEITGGYKIGFILDNRKKIDTFIGTLSECFPENLSGPPTEEIRGEVYYIIGEIINKLSYLYDKFKDI
jgi:hypothetical protein